MQRVGTEARGSAGPYAPQRQQAAAQSRGRRRGAAGCSFACSHSMSCVKKAAAHRCSPAWRVHSVPMWEFTSLNAIATHAPNMHQCGSTTLAGTCGHGDTSKCKRKVTQVSGKPLAREAQGKNADIPDSSKLGARGTQCGCYAHAAGRSAGTVAVAGRSNEIDSSQTDTHRHTSTYDQHFSF